MTNKNRPIREALEEKYGDLSALLDENSDYSKMPAGMTFIELRDLLNEDGNSK